MDSVKTRIERLSKALGVPVSVLSPQIGLSDSTLFAVKRAKNGIPSEYIRLLKEHYPRVNIEYLVMGEGDILLPDVKETDLKKFEILKKMELVETAVSAMKQELLELK